MMEIASLILASAILARTIKVQVTQINISLGDGPHHRSRIGGSFFDANSDSDSDFGIGLLDMPGIDARIADRAGEFLIVLTNYILENYCNARKWLMTCSVVAELREELEKLQACAQAHRKFCKARNGPEIYTELEALLGCASKFRSLIWGMEVHDGSESCSGHRLPGMKRRGSGERGSRCPRGSWEDRRRRTTRTRRTRSRKVEARRS